MYPQFLPETKAEKTFQCFLPMSQKAMWASHIYTISVGTVCGSSVQGSLSVLGWESSLMLILINDKVNNINNDPNAYHISGKAFF